MKPTFFATPAEFRAWFEAHHASAKELLVGFHKRGSGEPSITWPESVDEALCFGWIDGVRKSIDEDAYTIRFTPRKPTSIWSAINVAKVAALEKLGRMTAAGRRAFEKRKPERTGVYSFERNAAAELSADEERELRANKRAAEFFDSQPPWYRRTATHWVISPKREATRRRRFEHLLSQSVQGRTIGPLTRKPAEGENGEAATPPVPSVKASRGKTSKARVTKTPIAKAPVAKARVAKARASRSAGSGAAKAPRRAKTTARAPIARQASNRKKPAPQRSARAKKTAARKSRARATASARSRPKR